MPWCNVPNGHFVLGSEQVYIHDGSTKKVVGQDKWSEEFYNRLNLTRRDEVQCVYNGRTDTVWIKIPTTNNTEVWVYNVAEDRIEEIRNTQMGQHWFDFTTEGVPGAEARNRMISYGEDSYFIHEVGNMYNTSAINASLTRGMIQPLDGYSRSQMMRATPFYTGTGTLDMSFGGSNESGDAVEYLNTKNMVRGTDTKMDLRFTRRYLAYRFNTTDDITIAGFDAELSEKYKR